MKRIFIGIGILVVVLVVVSFGLGLSRKKNNARIQGRGRNMIKVDAYVVKPSLLVDEISVSGSLTGFEEVELKNEVGGRVVRMNLPEGRFVKKGTLLVKIFDDDLQANLDKLEAQLAIQKQIYKRQAELMKVNGISQNDYELTGLQVKSLEADIEIQKAAIRKTEVLAPFDGVIGLRFISPGAQITPSTLLATIRSENELKLDFSVPEKYSDEVSRGMRINFSLSNQDKKYEAVVMATEEGIDPSTRNLKVRAIVENRNVHLLPGSFTDVKLRLHENKNALMIPTESIIPNEENQSIIMARAGKAHFVEIKTGTRKASDIEVLDGIRVGDTIITSGILFLKEGDKLRYSTIKADSL